MSRRSSIRRLSAAAGRALAWLWARLLAFLEIVGLRYAPPEPPDQLLARFRLYHTEFRKLLQANESFLSTVADLEKKAYERSPTDPSLLSRRVVRMCADVFRMISSLNLIADGRYAALEAVLDRITDDLSAELAHPPDGEADVAFAVSLDAVDERDVTVGGGKGLHLGVLRRLGLPVPDGFVVTTAAYRALVAAGVSAEAIHSELMTIFAPEDVPSVAARLAARFRTAGVPEQVAQEILAAYDRLAAGAGAGGALRVAVRSSAVEEDGTLSFAGQFRTILGVTRETLVAAYLDVVISLYSAEAIGYRRLHKLTGVAAAMAVTVQRMVDADVSGVVYSRDPTTTTPAVLIQAVEGLGDCLADGATSPASYRATPAGATWEVTFHPGRQDQATRLASAGGVRTMPLPPERTAERLSQEEAITLAQWAGVLEAHFGGPQDLEWARARRGPLLLLQCRPLTLAQSDAELTAPLAGAEILVQGGETACPGAAAGPVVLVDEDLPPLAFPRGAVAVAPRSSPRLVPILSRAKAVVTERGSRTGHMASLARELRLPALVGCPQATAALHPGTLVTVDATAQAVYAGDQTDRLPANHLIASDGGAPAARRGSGPLLQHFERVLARVAPLNLTDAHSASFAPEHCETLHDLARFVHEKSYEEMFQLGAHLGDARSFAYQLDVFLPIDLYLVDLGGGLAPPPDTRQVKLRHICSTPLLALVRGMTHERLPRFGPRPIDTRGLLVIMMRHAVNNPESERTFRDPCYAIVSDTYLNYTARVGYHFGVVDSFCGPEISRNYINLHFRGGAADLVRRSRRVRAIASILQRLGLHAEVREDAVSARCARLPQEETARLLDQIGRLLQFMRQLDVAMTSEGAVDWVTESFLRGDYDLTNGGRPAS